MSCDATKRTFDGQLFFPLEPGPFMAPLACRLSMSPPRISSPTILQYDRYFASAVRARETTQRCAAESWIRRSHSFRLDHPQDRNRKSTGFRPAQTARANWIHDDIAVVSGLIMAGKFPAACGVPCVGLEDERISSQESQCYGVDVPLGVSGEVPTSGIRFACR